MIYRPRAVLELEVPIRGKVDEGFVTLSPTPIEVRWTKNHHLAADEITVTVPWAEAGVEPRQIKNGRVALWLWDENYEDFDKARHLRFTGMVKKVMRRMNGDSLVVDISAHDYTTLFLNMKPFPSRGVPEWTDTLKQAWEKICDHTGWKDPDAANSENPRTRATGIKSSVEQLRDRLRFPDDFVKRHPQIPSVQIGKAVPQRFHAISKPPHPTNSDAWTVWEHIVTAMGLMTYIDKDECIVTDVTENYDGQDPASFIYAHNIAEFEEAADTDISAKGVLLQSYNPLTGVLMESRYPLPGDERIKITKAVAKRAAKAGRDPSENETSGDYEPFPCHEITDQETLDRKAYQAYVERNRQEMEGSLTTHEMRVWKASEDPETDRPSVDLLSLRAGDAIRIVTDLGDLSVIRAISNTEERIRYLQERLGYAEPMARLVALNIDDVKFQSELFHVSALDVELGPETFKIAVKFHNLIVAIIEQEKPISA